MPKGIGILIGVLVVLIAAIGGWIWWDSAQMEKLRAQRQAVIAAAMEADASARAKRRADAPDAATTRSRGPFARLPENRYEAGELIVVDPPDDFDDVARTLGFSVTERVRLGSLAIELYRIRIPPGASEPEARQTLAARFPGLTIDFNHQFEMQAPKDYQDQMARAVIGWKKATPRCGAGITIGMIDASVDVTHPALRGRNIEFRSFHRKERRPGSADHGTAVAAILVGTPEWGGLLPGAELKAANMFELNETGREVGNAVGLLKSMNWMAAEKVLAINLSVAGGDNKVVRLALKKAKKANLVMVAAAGNWGSATRKAFPAAYADTLGVTALATGNVIYKKANSGDYIDFAAPGVRVYTADRGRGGRLQSGTSFAAPFITVLTALQIKSQGRKDAAQLRKLMQPMALDLGAKGRDDVFGLGLVDLEPKCPD